MKKGLLVIIALGFIFVLAACGGTDSSDTENADDSNTTEQAENDGATGQAETMGLRKRLL
ncbi:hypothetical protein [Virgibacillus dakarensis]|uniref:hypothetical protein n=1 Tax=Virgibacillus dakarensis TaxID=1917889 RepID=UPI000B45258E|nr:hypothetical protein [Virgibacillus dakarensis]